MSVPKAKSTTAKKQKCTRVGTTVPLSSIVGFGAGDPSLLQRENMDFEDFIMDLEAGVHNSLRKADGGGDINNTLLNSFEFPPLATTNTTIPIRSSLANISQYGAMVKKSSVKEFHISKLDFPPLPGAADESNRSVETDEKSCEFVDKDQEQCDTDFSDLNELLTITDSSSIISISDDAASTAYVTEESADVTESMDTLSFEQPSGRGSILDADDYGLLNLLPLLRAPDSCSTATMLTIGFDYEDLGIEFNTSEPLYERLISPLLDQPLAPLEPKQPNAQSLPEEYKVKAILPAINLKDRPEDTVFYIFYNIHGDLLQLEAAEELHNRGWRFHLDLQVWLFRIPDEPYEKIDRLVTGTFVVFDHIQWEKVLKFMEVNLDRLQERQTNSSAGEFNK